jgi:hypothetical protein
LLLLLHRESERADLLVPFYYYTFGAAVTDKNLCEKSCVPISAGFGTPDAAAVTSDGAE